MPRVTPENLRRALAAKPPAPAYYIHGSEGILKDEALSLLLTRSLDPGTRDFNLDIVSAQQLDPAELAATCATLPMMAERRVVVLRDVEAWRRKSKAKAPAVQYLEHPMRDTVLVMVQSNDDDADEELASRAISVECIAPTGDRLEAWLDAQLESHGVTVTADAREHLIRATGGDLGLLTAEVRKLAGLVVAGPIDADTVAAMVGIRFGETAEDWRDAVLRDETAHALALIPRLLETTGASGVRLVTLLGTSLLALQWARAESQRGRVRGAELADRIKSDLLFKLRPGGLGSYQLVSRLLAQVAGQWPAPRIRSALASVLDADGVLKDTRISDEAGIMTDLTLALGASRQRQVA